MQWFNLLSPMGVWVNGAQLDSRDLSWDCSQVAATAGSNTAGCSIWCLHAEIRHLSWDDWNSWRWRCISVSLCHLSVWLPWASLQTWWPQSSQISYSGTGFPRTSVPRDLAEMARFLWAQTQNYAKWLHFLFRNQATVPNTSGNINLHKYFLLCGKLGFLILYIDR